MDSKRFDNLTKSLASGQSRRSLIKGLLGLGGGTAVSAVALVQTEARRRGSVTSPTTPPPPTTTTEAPLVCEGWECGVDCCETEWQCCDGECCPSGYDCLTQRFPNDSNIEEETCCRSDLICGADITRCCTNGQQCCSTDGCCDGACFDPASTAQPGPGDPLCCPSQLEPCVTSAGTVCIDPATQCCGDPGEGDNNCPGLFGGDSACWICENNSCIPTPSGESGSCPTCQVCTDNHMCEVSSDLNYEACGLTGICCDGLCFHDGQCCVDADCGPCETCTQTGGCESVCNVNDVCCSDGCCPDHCTPVGECCIPQQSACSTSVQCCGDFICLTNTMSCQLCLQDGFGPCLADSDCCGGGDSATCNLTTNQCEAVTTTAPP